LIQRPSSMDLSHEKVIGLQINTLESVAQPPYVTTILSIA
jgi:hypothetical protein